MEKLVHTLLNIKELKFRLDDDFTDRLNRQYTATLLCLLAVLVSARHYFGEPIHCWCPEQCASNHEKYANMYCWIADVYYVPEFERMPQGNEPKTTIGYYQWVPIILLGQAALFYFPCIIWRLLNKRSGINIGIIMEAAMDTQTATNQENRERTLRYAVYLIDRYLMTSAKVRTGFCERIKQWLSRYCVFLCSRRFGNYLTATYIIVKLLYLANAIGQIFLLDFCLGYEFHLFGIQIVNHLIQGREWTPPLKFPKVTLCDFVIRQNTNTHKYTYQCVLPINIFNEKIFIFVWFWLLIVALLTLYSLIGWFLSSIYWQGQVKYVKRQIKGIDGGIQIRDKDKVGKFVSNYLRRDGVFVLRMVSRNTGSLVISEIFSALWEGYKPKHALIATKRRVSIRKDQAREVEEV